MLPLFAYTDTLIVQPAIEFCKVFKPWSGCKQPLSDVADLILDLAFLSASTGSTGNRFNEVVAAQLFKLTVKHLLFAV
jgi:hypothetical protein